MPWARQPDRVTDGHAGFLGEPVTGVDCLCRGCGEPYAPEPPPSREPVLGSSAGMAARHGDEQGVNIERNRGGK